MSKCGTCGSTDAIMGASNYRAWIQPCGFGKDSPKVPAMCDDSGIGRWTNVEITNLVHNLQGDPTTIYRRSFTNPCNVVAKKIVRAQPGNNTVDIQMDRLCGGIDIARLQDEKFNVYLQHQCCCGDGINFSTSWDGAIDVIEGIDFSGYTMPTLTDTGNDTEEELRIQLNGVTFDDFYTVAEVEFSEVAAAAGMTTGTRVNHARFHSLNTGCTNESCIVCGNTWYAIAESEFLIYQVNGGDVQEVQIAELAGMADNNAYIGFIGDTIYITYSDIGATTTDGYIFTTLDENGDPGIWADRPIALLTRQWAGTLDHQNRVYMFGVDQTGSGQIDVVDGSGRTNVLDVGIAATQINAMDACSSQVIAVGDSGLIWEKALCAETFTLITSPTGDDLTSVSVRKEDEIWIGTDQGQVFCTQNGGDTWEEVLFDWSGNGSPVRTIAWLDQGTGWILPQIAGSDPQSSWDGGDSWAADSPRVNDAPTATQLLNMDVPCCSNKNLSTNSVITVGTDGTGAGVVLLGKSASC